VKLGWEFIGHCQTNAVRTNELDEGRPRSAFPPARTSV
jgi:hypothetical protein